MVAVDFTSKLFHILFYFICVDFFGSLFPWFKCFGWWLIYTLTFNIFFSLKWKSSESRFFTLHWSFWLVEFLSTGKAVHPLVLPWGWLLFSGTCMFVFFWTLGARDPWTKWHLFPHAVLILYGFLRHKTTWEIAFRIRKLSVYHQLVNANVCKLLSFMSAMT